MNKKNLLIGGALILLGILSLIWNNRRHAKTN